MRREKKEKGRVNFFQQLLYSRPILIIFFILAHWILWTALFHFQSLIRHFRQSFRQSLIFSHSFYSHSFVIFSHLCSHGLQHTRLCCPSLAPWVCSNSFPWSSNAFQASHPLLPPSLPALNFSQHHGLFQWMCSSHKVAKILALQLQHQSFQWIFRVDFL